MADKEVVINYDWKVDTKPVYVWEATFTFTTNYDLPDNVIEAAVVRAVQNAQIVRVNSLKRSRMGDDDSISSSN